MKATQLRYTATLTQTNNQPTKPMDLTQYIGASIQVNGPVGGTGTINLEISNDGNTWVASGETAVNITAGTAFIQTTKKYYSAHIRGTINITAGAGDYVINMLGKDV